MKLMKLAAGIACATGVSAQSFDEDTTNAHCAAEWANDFAMRAYCFERQAAAWRDLQ